ncbi:MAG: nuclear transport factor 2 family protein [Blastocatellia bacterium]
MKGRLVATAALLVALATLGFAQGTENKNTANTNSAKPKMSKKAIERSLIAKEKALWEAVKKNDAKGFKRSFSADYVGVNEGGIHTLDDEVGEIADVKLTAYTLSDIKVAMPSGDTAILSYKVNSQGDYKGQDFSGDSYCSSVWINRGGRWVAVSHSEVKAAKTP